jgi:hypothetical protein
MNFLVRVMIEFQFLYEIVTKVSTGVYELGNEDK